MNLTTSFENIIFFQKIMKLFSKRFSKKYDFFFGFLKNFDVVEILIIDINRRCLKILIG